MLTQVGEESMWSWRPSNCVTPTNSHTKSLTLCVNCCWTISLGVTEDDFYNALGGIHALARGESGVLLAHGSVVPRRMFHQGRSIRAGYVEAVAVATKSRRQGLGSAIMDSIEHVIAGAYEMGALSASRDGAQLYAGRAWQAWRGTTSVVSPFGGIVRTPDDDDSVQVLVISATLDRDGDLACDWRNGASGDQGGRRRETRRRQPPTGWRSPTASMTCTTNPVWIRSLDLGQGSKPQGSCAQQLAAIRVAISLSEADEGPSLVRHLGSDVDKSPGVGQDNIARRFCNVPRVPIRGRPGRRALKVTTPSGTSAACRSFQRFFQSSSVRKN